MKKPDITLIQSESVPTIWNSKEVAKYLGLSVDWLERDRASGEPKIPYIRIGRSVRYRVVDVVDALASFVVGDAK